MRKFLLPLTLATHLIVGCSNKHLTTSSSEVKETAMGDARHPIKEIPAGYTSSATKEGKVVRIDYKTTSVKGANTSLDKHAYVYLPHNYKKGKKFNVFYLMHGGGGNAETVFKGEGQSSEFKNLLDNMIEKGELDPLLVVTPTFYSPSNTEGSISASAEATQNFHLELMHDLIPAVEGTYSTYAEATTPEALKKARSHRAFGGFSMGSVTTWYAFIHSLDYFEYFMPMSGDSWIMGVQGGASKPDETAAYLNKAVLNSVYKANDFFIYALTGSSDIAFTAMNNQVAAMKKYPDTFRFNEDFSKGSIYFNVLKDGKHTYEYVLQYVYNALPSFWKKSND